MHRTHEKYPVQCVLSFPHHSVQCVQGNACLMLASCRMILESVPFRSYRWNLHCVVSGDGAVLCWEVETGKVLPSNFPAETWFGDGLSFRLGKPSHYALV